MTKTAFITGVLQGVLIFLLVCMAGCRGVDPGSFEIEPQTEREVVSAAAPAEEAPDATEAPPAMVQNDLPEKGVVATGPAGPEAQDSTAVPEEAVKLTLKFVPGHTVTYQVTSEVQKSVQWQGTPGAKPAAFKGGRTAKRLEMTFEQEVESVDAEGDAVVRITIKALKYLNRVRDSAVLDFDSTRANDPNNPLANLVGGGYKLEISARGKVLALIDVEPLRQAVQGTSAAHDTARRLLSREQILARHQVVALSALDGAAVRPGQDWSSVKTFSFGMMGAKSFEKVYTLKEVQRDAGSLAVIEMKAIPSAAMAEEMHKSQAVNPFSQMFDNTESYEGRLELELDTGTIRRYVEEMRTEWVVADPEAVSGGAQPSALRMGATQLYRLENVE